MIQEVASEGEMNYKVAKLKYVPVDLKISSPFPLDPPSPQASLFFTVHSSDVPCSP